MDKAVSISQGGKIIDASNFSLKDSDYWKYGLTCPSCSEPVYWKLAGETKSHFSHFPKTSFSQNCNLRTESTSSSCKDKSFSIKESSISLRDIQSQLINFILSSSKDFSIDQTNVLLADEIKPDSIEQNIINLLTINKVNNIEILKNIFDHQRVSLHLFDPTPYTVIKETNWTIAKEILSFITASSNISILYSIVHFYRQKEDSNNFNMIPRIRRKIIKNIGHKDWYYEFRFSLWDENQKEAARKRARAFLRRNGM